MHHIVQQLQRRQGVLLTVGDYLAHMGLSVLVLVYYRTEHPRVVLGGSGALCLLTGEIPDSFDYVALRLLFGLGLRRVGLLLRNVKRGLVLLCPGRGELRHYFAHCRE